MAALLPVLTVPRRPGVYNLIKNSAWQALQQRDRRLDDSEPVSNHTTFRADVHCFQPPVSKAGQNYCAISPRGHRERPDLGLSEIRCGVEMAPGSRHPEHIEDVTQVLGTFDGPQREDGRTAAFLPMDRVGAILALVEMGKKLMLVDSGPAELMWDNLRQDRWAIPRQRLLQAEEREQLESLDASLSIRSPTIWPRSKSSPRTREQT